MNSITKENILAGDLDAYGEVVREYQGMVKGYALRRLGDWTLAEEVVQLTFIRAYQKLEEFRADEEFGVWLCVTAKYLILSELEKRRREVHNRDKFRDVLELEIATAAADDLAVDFKQDRFDALQDCVDQLQEGSAELIKRRYFAKMSCKDIAVEKNRSLTWVTSTLSRVRKALRTCLQNRGEPEVLL
ncbi:MAG: sigma-70 family RNA polymerase sigma factor [Verrucomicrobiota bacterium]